MEHEPAFTRVSFDLWGLGQHDPEINECYMRTYGQWRGRIIQTLGEFMPDLSEEEKTLVAAMIVSMLMGGAMQYLSNPKAFDLDHYVDFCLRTALLSIGRQMPEEPTNDINR